MILFNGQDLEHIIGLKTKTLEDTYRLDRLLVYNSVLSALSRKQVLQLETFTEVRVRRAAYGRRLEGGGAEEGITRVCLPPGMVAAAAAAAVAAAGFWCLLSPAPAFAKATIFVVTPAPKHTSKRQLMIEPYNRNSPPEIPGTFDMHRRVCAPSCYARGKSGSTDVPASTRVLLRQTMPTTKHFSR